MLQENHKEPKIKYITYSIVFSEVPDEISLAFFISNCPNRCKKCHSPNLQLDIGTELTFKILDELLNKLKSQITTVLFMGGDASPIQINTFCEYIHKKYKLYTAWYSGNDNIHKGIDLNNFDYIKIGHYDYIKGPLTSETTNQCFYKIKNGTLLNITSKFKKYIH